MRLPVVQTARSDGPRLVCWCMLNVAESDRAELGPARALLRDSFQCQQQCGRQTRHLHHFFGVRFDKPVGYTTSSLEWCASNWCKHRVCVGQASKTGASVGFVWSRAGKLLQSAGLSSAPSSSSWATGSCSILTRMPLPRWKASFASVEQQLDAASSCLCGEGHNR